MEKNNYSIVDLKNLFNHKLLFSKNETTVSDEENGLDGIFIDNGIFLGNNVKISGIPFAVNSTSKDNIVCREQKVIVNQKCDNIYFLGFNYWGANICKSKLKFKGEQETDKNIYFNDWSNNQFDETFSNYFLNAKTGVFQTEAFGKINHNVFFHIYKIECEKEKFLEYITLPDYLLMHIFAITLERKGNG
jgi:hypothetical protein